MTSEKLNCWQGMKCGREPHGTHVDELGVCPATVETTCDGINSGFNAGRFCWVVVGSSVCSAVKAEDGKAIETCHQCPFFRRVRYEQGPHLQLVRPGLGLVDPGELHRLLNNVIELTGISRDIFACLSMGALLQGIAEHACTATGSSSTAVYLVEGDQQPMTLAAYAGSLSRPKRVGLDDDNPVAEAVRSGHLYNGLTSLDGCDEPVAVAAVPIVGHDKAAGALELLKVAARFSRDDEWFLWQFGLTAGLAIDNARHVEDLQQLRQFDKAKSRFVALLMHHITSPLATIACSLQALAQLGDKLSDAQRQKLFDNSLERIKAIQTLSKRLLDLAAIRHGTSLGNIQPVRLGELLREEVAAREGRARDKGLEIVLTRQGPDAAVWADPDGLRLIFGNLINNAIKYSKADSERVDVELTSATGAAGVCVRDRGIGIPAEERQRVFEEFHRAENVGEVKASGFGIGLAAVKELVDRYNGRIDLESEVGVGTSITVEFPLVAARPAQ